MTLVPIVVGVGDSVLSPVSPINGGCDPFEKLVVPQLLRSVEWRNVAWPGRTTEALAEQLESYLRTITTRPILVILQVGTNDFTFDRDQGDGSIPYQEICRSVAIVKKFGARTAVCTLLPRDDAFVLGGQWTARHQQGWAAYNELIRANDFEADFIVDLAENPMMGHPDALDNTDVYADRLHPTFPCGWGHIAPDLAQAANGFLGESWGCLPSLSE